MRTLSKQNDRIWLAIWLAGLGGLALWDVAFLNRPSLLLVQTAALNTAFACFVAIVCSMGLGWIVGVTLYFLETRQRSLYLSVTFLLNVVRSFPQIVGALAGYTVLTLLIENGILRSQLAQLSWIAFVIGLFVFPEVVDLVRERIAYHSKLDFFGAMLSCGIKESRIVNREILWKNSRAHLLHKFVSIAGITIFLQCSIDFVVSVGLSTDVSLSNFPVTLGSLLAKLDSKQDILAIGTTLLRLDNVSSLFFQHLQGISLAFIIVFSLLCLYNISNGLVKRFKL